MATDDRRNPRRAFYDRHLPFVLEVARPMLRDEDDVREVVSSVFADVLPRWDALGDVRDMRQWFREVTRNHCRRQWRERYRSASLLDRVLDAARGTTRRGDLAEVPAPRDEGPEHLHERRRMREDFLRAFYALDEEEQAVIQMRYLDPELTRAMPDEELTLDELATTLGWPKIRVRRRIESARAKLSQTLSAWRAPAASDAPPRRQED